MRPQRLSISVALCTHNGERFIREQVRSICLQTRPPSEIVLSDDASSDGSVELVRETVADCNGGRLAAPIGLRVLQNVAPLRVTKNFEQAVRACAGDLVALSDQDDIWRPERLERMAGEFERRVDLLLLHTDARLVDGERRDLERSLLQSLEARPDEIAQIHSGHAFDVLLRRNLVTGATVVFRRALCDDALPFPAEWLHDEWLATVAAALGAVDVMQEPLIDYRQHGANQVGARRRSLGEKVRLALASRGDMHAKRVTKAERLLERLTHFGDRVPAECIEQARRKLAHERLRAGLPAERFARLLPVLREMRAGGYSNFGYGMQGAMRDLLEAV
jgi:hypothetical protein